MNKSIPTDFPYTSHFVEVNGSKMHYIEQGKGDPILFLHGIPTSCYLWRNIIPHLSTLGRCIAVDLIGMGKSAKPDIEYSIQDHIQYIEKFIEALNLKKITLVMHGWGSLIGFDYAMRHEKNCKGLIFYEAYIRSLNGEDLSLPLQEQVFLLEEEMGDATTNGVSFIDKVLPQATLRTLTEDEMEHYREPFQEDETIQPLRQYLKELPHGNKKNKANQLIESYSKKLMRSKLPKLLLYSIPGFITTIATVIWAKEHLPNLEVAEIGEDLHYAQESNPFLMGETMSIWLQAVEQNTKVS